MTNEPARKVPRRSSPSVPVFYPDWLLLNELKRDMTDALYRYGRGKLLDVGCGARPYENLSFRGDTWIGLDLADNPLADIHGTADAIPLPNASVDTILCSQVLEHVAEPARVLSECFRVLKPTGALILSVPQYWPLHEEPRDFLRYTEYGLKAVFERAGFRVVSHLRQGRGVAVAGQALNNAILCAGDTFKCKNRLWFKASKAPLYLLINLLTVSVNSILRSKRDVLNHLFVGIKP